MKTSPQTPLATSVLQPLSLNKDTEDEYYMRLAIGDALVAAAEGNTAVAAVIVRAGKVLGLAHATQQTGKNPSQHAEINAIGTACASLESADLSGTSLYCTLEPCPMCAWAIRVAGIKRVVIGARYKDLNRTDMGDYTFERFMAMMNRPDIELVQGVLTAECIALRKAWMERTGRVV
jgi:tRNA(adenine34) deaminase